MFLYINNNDMNRYRNTLFVVLLTASGCGDFLSETPDNRTKLDTKEKIAELLVSAYPEANYITFCEAMTDNVEDNPSASKDARNADPYFWRDATSTDQDSPEFYWNACYAAIAATNHALEHISSVPDSADYNDQKGEALVARAYSHFMLVNLFAQTYDAQTAGYSPGIPYVTRPETVSFKTYERGTVQSVYDHIEKDLLAGMELINDDAYENGTDANGVSSYHFTRAAAHAFAVRYYLFRRDYEKVLEHASQVFRNNDFASNLRPWNTTYRTYSASELMATYTRSSEKANLLLCETASEWARSFNGLEYATGANRYLEMFTSNPAGGRYAFSTLYGSTGIYFVYKFREHFVRIGTNATTGYPYTIVPLFTAEEVLLSRAEAYAMLDRFHEALADLNLWASTRIADYDPAAHTITYNKLYTYYQLTRNRDQLVACALDFRRVEFLHEGLRWFDILRHRMPVTHTTNAGDVFTLSHDDPRRVLQIPREAIAMGGLAPNPR